MLSVLDPQIDAIEQLSHYTDLDVIIDATDNKDIHSFIKNLNLPNTDFLTKHSARLIFSSGNDLNFPHDNQSYRTTMLENLHEIRNSLYLSKNKKELLRMILSISLESLDAESGSIMLVNHRKRTLSLEMAKGLKPEVMNALHSQKLGKGIAGKVIRNGRPMLINGRVNPEDIIDTAARSDVQYAICCPMLIEKEVVGVINVNRKDLSPPFISEDLRYLQKLANFTADIIRTSREYERSIDASFSLSVVAGIQEILQHDIPHQECLNLAMMKIVNSLQGSLSNIYWFDKEQQKFFISGSSEFNISLHQNDQIRLNDFFTGRVLRLQKAFTFNVKLGNSGYKKWFLAQPIVSNDQIIGLLMVFIVSDKNQFDKEQALLAKVASLLKDSINQKLKVDNSNLNAIRYSVLSEISFDMANIHNIRQLAHVIVVNACMLLEVETCILSLYNELMDSFEHLESFSIKGTSHIDSLKKIENSIAMKASKINEIQLIEDLESALSLSVQISSRSVMTLCLRQNSMQMGAISVYDKNVFGAHERKGFTEHDKEVFLKFCYQTTKALNRFIVLKPNK
jgi:GAF domain-containing protein